MNIGNMKKYTIKQKISTLKHLNEGRVFDVDENTDLKTSEVSNIIPKGAKIEKDDKLSFEEYKKLYNDVITQKCVEDYGTDTDKQLWEDTAKEMFLKSKEYIPTEEDKTQGTLDKKEEVKERNLSKDLFQDEASRRIYNRLVHLDVYLEELEDALKNNNTDLITANTSKIKGNTEYLIPALNIKGGVKGLINYLKETNFDFENRFKETADLLNTVYKEEENKLQESSVSDYTLSEIKKVIDSNGDDFTIKIVNANEDVQTKTLDIDREDLINIYNTLGGDKITEDYEKSNIMSIEEIQNDFKKYCNDTNKDVQDKNAREEYAQLTVKDYVQYNGLKDLRILMQNLEQALDINLD